MKLQAIVINPVTVRYELARMLQSMGLVRVSMTIALERSLSTGLSIDCHCEQACELQLACTATC
jgi:hypothetical protein